VRGSARHPGVGLCAGTALYFGVLTGYTDTRILLRFPYLDRHAICCLAMVCLAAVWLSMLTFNSYLRSDDALAEEQRQPYATERPGYSVGTSRTLRGPQEVLEGYARPRRGLFWSSLLAQIGIERTQKEPRVLNGYSSCT
jgi:hypothetical protein